jgi:hypothetical protein
MDKYKQSATSQSQAMVPYGSQQAASQAKKSFFSRIPKPSLSRFKPSIPNVLKPTAWKDKAINTIQKRAFQTGASALTGQPSDTGTKKLSKWERFKSHVPGIPGRKADGTPLGAPDHLLPASEKQKQLEAPKVREDLTPTTGALVSYDPAFAKAQQEGGMAPLEQVAKRGKLDKLKSVFKRKKKEPLTAETGAIVPYDKESGRRTVAASSTGAMVPYMGGASAPMVIAPAAPIVSPESGIASSMVATDVTSQASGFGDKIKGMLPSDKAAIAKGLIGAVGGVAKAGVGVAGGLMKKYMDKDEDGEGNGLLGKIKDTIVDKGKDVVDTIKDRVKGEIENIPKILNKITQALQNLPELMKQRLNELKFETTDTLDLTVPVDISTDPLQEKIIKVGVTYTFNPGVGSLDKGYSSIEAVFHPTSALGILGLGPEKIIKKLPKIKELMRLQGEDLFAIKLALLVKTGLRDIKESKERFKYISNNLYFLLARLSITVDQSASKEAGETVYIKGPDVFLRKLPAIFTNALNAIEVPVRERDLIEYQDRADDAGFSALQIELSKMRKMRGYDQRTVFANAALMPLLSSELSRSDIALFLYSLEHHVYDLNKGFKDTDNAEAVKHITVRRAKHAEKYLENVLTKATGLFEPPMLQNIHALQSYVGKLATGEDVEPMARPEMERAGDANAWHKVDVPKLLNVMYYQFTKLFTKLYEHEEGELYDDSYLSKWGTAKHLFAFFFQLMQERKKSDFDFKTFVQEELGILYERSKPLYFAQIEKIFTRFMPFMPQDLPTSLDEIVQVAKEQAAQYREEYLAGILDSEDVQLLKNIGGAVVKTIQQEGQPEAPGVDLKQAGKAVLAKVAESDLATPEAKKVANAIDSTKAVIQDAQEAVQEAQQIAQDIKAEAVAQ